MYTCIRTISPHLVCGERDGPHRGHRRRERQRHPRARGDGQHHRSHEGRLRPQLVLARQDEEAAHRRGGAQGRFRQGRRRVRPRARAPQPESFGGCLRAARGVLRVGVCQQTELCIRVRVKEKQATHISTQSGAQGRFGQCWRRAVPRAGAVPPESFGGCLRVARGVLRVGVCTQTEPHTLVHCLRVRQWCSFV